MTLHLHHLQSLAAPAVLAIACALAGCASAPPVPVEVRVPVYVPCVPSVPARPTYEFGRLPASASAGEKVLTLARDWLRGRKYEAELEAVIAGCIPPDEKAER